MLRNSKYIYGDVAEIMIPMKINFGEYILKKLLEHGNNIALVNAETEESKTYRQIVEESTIIALSLSRMGVGKGHTIAVCSENHKDFWPLFIGAACTGARITLINFTYAKGEMQHALKISKPSIVVCSRLAYELQEYNFKTLNFIEKIYVFGNERVGEALPWSSMSEGRCTRVDSLEVADVRGQTDPLLVLYSSGTTGLAKGVELTHWNVISSICCTFESSKAIKGDVAVSFAPWFHALGLMSVIGGLTTGRRIVFLPMFDLNLYLDTIQKYKISLLTMVPPLLVLLSKLDIYQDLSSIQYIFVGAAPLRRETIDDVKIKFPNVEIYQGYGLTECTLAVTRDSPDDVSLPVKIGSVGTVVPGITVKIVDIKTREPLGPNEAGEICIKGPTVMKGYIGKDERDDFDEEGFFRTGDIGYYDTDKYFFIVDRLKELIKYKGFQVAPAEIEAVLLQHDAVRDAGVVGIADREGGEVPLAFVALQPDRNVTEEELKQFIADRLSNPKQLRGGVRFVDDIPKNPSGKILRKQLRVMAADTKSKL